MSNDQALKNQRRLAAQLESAEINDAARLANEIQRAALAETGAPMKRSDALREAERIQRKFGIGWSLAPGNPS